MSQEVKKWVEFCDICKDFKRVPRVKVFNDGLPDITKMKPLDCVAVDLGYLGISKPFLILVDEYSGLKASWPMRDSRTESVTKPGHEKMKNRLSSQFNLKIGSGINTKARGQYHHICLIFFKI